MEDEPRNASLTVHVERVLPDVTIQIVRFGVAQTFSSYMHSTDNYRLDQCLTPRPRNTRAGFRELWGPHRFDPLGDVFLLPPGQSMQVRGDRGWQSSILCHLRPALVERWLGEDWTGEGGWTDKRLEACLDIGNPHVRTIMGRLAEEAHRPGLGSEELIGMAVNQLAIELGRYFASIEEGPVTGGLAAWRLRTIDDRLRDLANMPTLAELADLCNLSVRQLTRGFRTSRGCSIKDYLARSRIEEAKRRLAGDDSVKAIGFAVGFASPSAFAYAFRAANGITPLQFRQRMRRAAR